MIKRPIIIFLSLMLLLLLPVTKTTAAAAVVHEIDAPKSHIKARLNEHRPASYPVRFEVSEEEISWRKKMHNYAPDRFVKGTVLSNDRLLNPKGWADPEDFTLVRDAGKGFRKMMSWHGLSFDPISGLPRNPVGRTGLCGRGLLGKWGANHAADPIITRTRKDGQIEGLFVIRADNGQMALPGGMVDDGEEMTKALKRELEEETGLIINLSEARAVYRGYVDDPRNTDNAWMETVAMHVHYPHGSLMDKFNPQPKADDVKFACWQVITPALEAKLYADHGKLIKLALQKISAKEE
jgi:ADP-ribose pyrophosphatase